VTKNVISVDSSSNVVFGKYLSVGKDGKVNLFCVTCLVVIAVDC